MLPKNLRPLLPYIKRYRWGYVAGTLCIFLTNGIQIMGPKVLGTAADALHEGVTHHKLLFYAGLLLAIAIFKGIFQFLTRWIMIGISRDIEYDLRNDLFAKLEGLSYSYYQRNRTGDIMARATNDLGAVRNLLGPAIMYSANTVVLMTGALAFMISISPRLTLYTFLPLPAASILIQYFGRRIHDRFERIQAMFSDISARAQENFSGARLIRAYVQEEPEIRAFETENQEYIRRSLKLVRLMGMLWPTLGIDARLRHRARPVARRARSAERTHHSRAIRLVQRLHAATDLADHRAGIRHQSLPARHSVPGAQLNEIMQEQPQIKDAPAAQGREIEGTIEFRGLNFSYDGKPVLHDVNLTIPAGSSLAIVGPTGSGKTTLVDLIPRIYDAEPGMVLIDGRPIREYSLASLRRMIGFVPQETFLFSERIRENIALESIRPRTKKFGAPPTLPISRPTSKASPRVTKQWSANAASRSPEGRNSARRLPEP